MTKAIKFSKPNKNKSSNKAIKFSKPHKNKSSNNADDWIKSGNQETADTPLKQETADTPLKQEKEPTKRLTLDIPQSWHIKIKTHCAENGVKMTDEILPLLKTHFKI